MAVLAPPVQVVPSGAPPFVHVPSGAPPFVAVTGLAPPIMLVDSGAPPITLFNEDGSLWAGGAGAAVGGAALLTGETDGFATDFIYATDASRVAVKVAGVVTSYGLDGFFANGGTSPKMVYDVAGALVWSPHNYRTQSQTFDVAPWAPSNGVVVANQAVAPDGTTTMDLFYPSTTGSARWLASGSVPALTNVIPVSFSVYAKAAGKRWLSMLKFDGSINAAWFDLQNGVLGSVGSGYTSAIQAVGNGIYRCTITATTPTVVNYNTIIVVDADGLNSVTANGTDGLYLWGAQTNRGDVASAYLPTTTAARFGLPTTYDPVTHAALGLWQEPVATNLLLNNATLSTQSVTVTAVAHTLSFWGTGTITLSGVSTAGPLAGTGASNRVSLTFTPTAGSLTLTVTGTVSNAQLETGTLATSFIPCFGASVTRAADQPNFTPASINYSATAGSWWLEIYQLSIVATNPRNIVYSSAAAPFISTASNQFQLLDSTSVAKTTTALVNATHKAACAFQAGDRALTADGLAVASDAGQTTNLLAPGATIYPCGLGSTITNGYYRKLRYVPRRKTNAELVTETV